LLIPHEKCGKLHKTVPGALYVRGPSKTHSLFDSLGTFASAKGKNRKPEIVGSLKVALLAEVFAEASHDLQNSKS